MDYSRDDNRKSLGKGWGEDDGGKTSKWLKLESGEAVEFVPVGEPECFEVKFERDDEPKKRWSIDIWVPRDKALKTWEMSRSVFSDLKRQRQLRGDKFDLSVLRLERQGAGMATRYSLDFVKYLDSDALDELNGRLMRTGSTPVGVGETRAGDDIPF